MDYSRTKKFKFRRSFNKTKWRINVHSLQDRFMEEGNNESKSCNVLGYCWNSSDDVLNVTSEKPLKNHSRNLNIFVKNRVDQIKKISDLNFWKPCPGYENCAWL